MNVVAFADEVGVRQDADLNQGVAWQTVSGSPTTLLLQAQNLAVAGAGRNVDLERGSVGQDYGLLAAVDGIEKVEVKVISDVSPASAPGGAARTSKDFGENIIAAGEVIEIGKARSTGVVRPAFTIGEIPIVLPGLLLGT
ncbi:hypothetical protein BDS110ZK12_79590 [Bradyrhizobium diazoefficiens]|uniref:Uncharacterized protein n=1 Tax=Bradyrhizobium diazoefficiens TaxID=1355477 RepID=A0A810BPC4_9BRAD|nr:hypothetical protein XF8B_72960 [Bradyrhizobium diazoefficiens]